MNDKPYTVKYHADGKQHTKVIRAATTRGALMKFKRVYGIKGIVAQRVYTKAERAALNRTAKSARRRTYFDGRTMCYFNDELVVSTGYEH